jgi:uncharacterized membrane protein YphA (DoxX/SURF4 family)
MFDVAWIEFWSRLVPGVILALAGASKALNFRWFVKALRNYRLLPAAVIVPTAGVVAALELFAGVGLILDLLSPWPAYIAAAMFAVFAGTLISTLIRRQKLSDCGCISSCKSAPGVTSVLRVCGLCGLVLVNAQRRAMDNPAAQLLFLLSTACVLATIAWDLSVGARRHLHAPESSTQQSH